MEPRPTPTSPRYIHRFDPPPPANVPQLLATAFAAAILTTVIGAVVLRLNRPAPTTVVSGTSQPVHPFERLREQRGSAVVAFLRSDGTIGGAGVAVSDDGWILTAASIQGSPATPDDLKPTVQTRAADPSTPALFEQLDARLNPVPFATVEERFLGEDAALVVPGTLPNERTVLPASVVATSSTRTGSGSQTSDTSPTELLLAAPSVVPIGTPAFTLSGDLIGLATASEGGFVHILPVWHLGRAMASVLSSAKVERPSLGLIGRPAEVLDPATTGFVVDPGGVASGSAAERAGVREGDAVERLDDLVVGLDGSLGDLLLGYAPGDRATLHIRRSGQERVVEVTLGRAA